MKITSSNKLIVSLVEFTDFKGNKKNVLQINTAEPLEGKPRVDIFIGEKNKNAIMELIELFDHQKTEVL